MPITNGQAVMNFGTLDETWGLCKNIEVEQEGKKTEVLDGVEDTIGTIHTGKKKKVTGTYEVLAGALGTDPPEDDDLVGSEITLKTESTDTITVIVDSSKKAYERGGITAWSFEGYYYPELVTE